MNLLLWIILLVDILIKIQNVDGQGCRAVGIEDRKNSAPCLRSCANARGKRQKKKCLKNTKCKCDPECGYSCINLRADSKCDSPPKVEGVQTSVVYRKTKKGLELTKENFKLHDVAVDNCTTGYWNEGSSHRVCVPGRGWTGSTTCTRACGRRNPAQINSNRMLCGTTCHQSSDCPGNFVCKCDGACGRTCVNPDVTCPNITNPNNGYVEYMGEGLSRSAYYICKEGFYLQSGHASRKCTGGGTWTGQPAFCAVVTCGNPYRAIHEMNGWIVEFQPNAIYRPGHQLEFDCGSRQKLIGNKRRNCTSNGLWSGIDTICDVKDGNTQRCPHPGVPINGRLVSWTDGFAIGSVVKFSCDDGYLLIGEAVQECLYFLQWSGTRTPQCKDPRYADSGLEAIGKLQRVTKDIKPPQAMLGRAVSKDFEHGNEVFFVFDMSKSVNDISLENAVEFAKRLVHRLSPNGISRSSTKYGIVIFASKAKTVLNVNLNEQQPNAKSAITLLQNIYDNREILRREILSGTYTTAALRAVNEQIGVSHVRNNKTMKHVFILTDGKHNIGSDPALQVLRMTSEYTTDAIEFYSITSCVECQTGERRDAREAQEELKKLTSNKEENYIFISNFYQLNTLLDKVTDARVDYTKCGEAGDVGSIKQQARVERVLGGTEASDRSWPWQALITIFRNKIVDMYKDEMQGGGCLISNRWVLSAAHLFSNKATTTKYVITLGMHRKNLQDSNEFNVHKTKVFRVKFIVDHPAYGDRYENDIALMRIGKELKFSRNGKWKDGESDFVEYTEYIRPVCLPCSEQSCVLNAMMSENPDIWNANLNVNQRCKIEENWLLQTGNAEKSILTVVTGFGHNTTRNESLITKPTTTDKLMQGLLKFLPHQQCIDWFNHIGNITNREEWLDHDAGAAAVENMICAVSAVENKTIDACQGDSGGPVVREVRNPTTLETCWVLIGIVSNGYYCGQKTSAGEMYPGYYTNVARFIPWIEEEMAKQRNK